MKNLRQLTWTTKCEKDESELILLREQNSVLKEVVKNLKRKVSIFCSRLKENRDTQVEYKCETLPRGRV